MAELYARFSAEKIAYKCSIDTLDRINAAHHDDDAVMLTEAEWDSLRFDKE